MKIRYSILKKHFEEKTTPREELFIKRFIRNNNQEYFILRQLWLSHRNISITDFDANTAWNKIVVQARKNQSGKTTGYHVIRRVAAVAAVFLLVASMIYLFRQTHDVNRYQTELTSRTDRLEMRTLEDGTKVWLNRYSTLWYPEAFKDKKRVVKLEGEAFFEVTKNPERPFIVETNYSDIKVLGTSFNINTDSLTTRVYVKTGKVNVHSKYSDKNTDLLPDEMVLTSANEMIKSTINNPNYLSWKTGIFIFEETPLPEVINDLNRFYPKPIILNLTKNDLLFSARFDQTKQEDIIEILKITFNLDIHENTNSYEIR